MQNRTDLWPYISCGTCRSCPSLCTALCESITHRTNSHVRWIICFCHLSFKFIFFPPADLAEFT